METDVGSISDRSFKIRIRFSLFFPHQWTTTACVGRPQRREFIDIVMHQLVSFLVFRRWHAALFHTCTYAIHGWAEMVVINTRFTLFCDSKRYSKNQSVVIMNGKRGREQCNLFFISFSAWVEEFPNFIYVSQSAFVIIALVTTKLTTHDLKLQLEYIWWHSCCKPSLHSLMSLPYISKPVSWDLPQNWQIGMTIRFLIRKVNENWRACWDKLKTYIDAHITDTTMRASRRSVELTGGTPLKSERRSVYVNVPV